MRKLYENPTIDRVRFAGEEVLAASSQEPSNAPTKDDQPITMPFIPAP